MSIITQVSDKMQEVLNIKANEVAKSSGFIQRKRKFTACAFLQTLVFGWLQNPEASYADLAQIARVFEVDVSRQAIVNRMTDKTATFLKAILESAASECVSPTPQQLPLLKQFKGVYVQDSTWLSLPDELSSIWKGTRCKTTDKKAAIKLQVRFDVLTGAFSHFQLTDGITPDTKTEQGFEPLPAGSLRLADLGYFSLDTFEELTQAGVFWLSRLKVDCKLFDEHQNTFCLHNHLQAINDAQVVDIKCFVGATKRLPARLVAVRCSEEDANKNRRRIKSEARRRGVTPSKKKLQLADWHIYITNIDIEQLTPIQVATVYRVRWQVELMFKSFKSVGIVNTSRSTKPYRILCEVYAKLIAQLLRHWIMLSTGWRCIQHNIIKTAELIEYHARTLMICFHKSKTAFLRTLRYIKQDMLHSDCGENRSGKHITYKHLKEAENP